MTEDLGSMLDGTCSPTGAVLNNGLKPLSKVREVGHWEGDTSMQDHKETDLVMLAEQRSGFLLAGQMGSFQM